MTTWEKVAREREERERKSERKVTRNERNECEGIHKVVGRRESKTGGREEEAMTIGLTGLEATWDSDCIVTTVK